MLLASVAAACRGGSPTTPATANGGTTSAAPTAPTAPTSPANGSRNATTTIAADAPPTALRLEVLERRPHDTSAFTEGLEVVDGRLFESTGLQGSSSLREVDPVSGKVLRLRQLPKDYFGEGLTALGNQLVQLTWRNGVALVWDRDTFNEVRRFSYQGEGWGLCYDATGNRLVQSDGSNQLTFRNPADFSVIGKLAVTRQGKALDKLNELECAPDGVWANVWLTDKIVRIDPATGRVTGEVDAKGLAPANRGTDDVLNGIARLPDGTWLVTGKHWPTMYLARFNP